MEITLATEYAIRAMLYLAKQPTESITRTSEISKEGEIPLPFLQKIIGLLSKAKLVIPVRGIKGGIKLGKPPLEITLLEIIETVEGRIYFNKCFYEPDFCNKTSWCPVHKVWSEAQKLVRDHLKKSSLLYLANQEGLNICGDNNLNKFLTN